MDTKKIKKFFYRKEGIITSIGVLVLVILSCSLVIKKVLSVGSGEQNSSIGTSTTTPVKFVYFSQVDGRGVTSSLEQMPRMVAIMIDNSPDVTSQSGLSQAKIVYEALAEGGITRYLAFFEKDQSVEMVGPVRSARMYFLDWVREYGDAMYVHVGGSPEALSFLKGSTMFDINEFGWGKYFWRDATLNAPHNVLTKSENWQALFEKLETQRPKKEWQGWPFSDVEVAGTSTTTQTVTQISIPYTFDYKVSWVYNPTTTVYERFINKKQDIDRERSAVTATNVIVQFNSTKVIDEVGRRDIETLGEGEVLVLKKGKQIRGVWKKESVTSRTRFYDEAGKEIPLTPGKTWIQVVPKGTLLDVAS